MPEQPTLKFKIPKLREVEGYAVEMPDGSIELRTKEQLEKLPKEEKLSGVQEDKGSKA